MDTEDQIPLSLPLHKGGITPLWPPAQEGLWPGGQRGATCLREAASAKAGGRFSEAYVFFIMDSLVILVREYQRVSSLSIECHCSIPSWTVCGS